MFSKFSVLPTASIYLKGSKRLLHMSKKFACANVTNLLYRKQSGLNIQDGQPSCSGSRYSPGGATIQMRLMSTTDSKDGDFDKSKKSKNDLKSNTEDTTTDVKVVKKVFRRKSRKESRDYFKKGDRLKFSSKHRRNQRQLTVDPIFVNAKKETGFKFPHQQVADPLKNNAEHKGIDIFKTVGISQSTLPPKKLHVEYIESINLKDIELKKNPASSIDNFKPNSDTKGIKRNLKLASEATQITNLYLESKYRFPKPMEKENTPQSEQWGNETGEPNFRVIVNLGSIAPMDKESNSNRVSNDTQLSPKDTQTKPPVGVITIKKEIPILPLNAGHKVDTPQNIVNAERNKNLDKYKPLGLRYIKFSKMLDRVAPGNIKLLGPSQNSLPVHHTTQQRKSKVEELSFSEMLKPTNVNASPVPKIEAEKLSSAMTPEVKKAKHLKNNTTLQKQSNSEIFQLPATHKTTSSATTEVEPSKAFQSEKFKELNHGYNITPQKSNEIKLKSALTPIITKSEVKLTVDRDTKVTKADTPTLQKKTKGQKLNFSELLKPARLNASPSSKVETEKLSFAMTQEFKSAKHSKNSTPFQKLPELYKTTSFEKNAELTQIKNEPLSVAKESALENKKSKELNRSYNRTPQLHNEIKLESPLTPITFNSEIKLTADQDIKVTNADTPTLQRKQKVEKSNFSEVINPTRLNVIPVSENDVETQQVNAVKHPKNTTTLQKQSNSDIFQLPAIYKPASSKNTAHSIQKKTKPLLVAKELETTLKDKSNSDVLKLSEKFKSTANFEETHESVRETKSISNSIVKGVKLKSEVEPSKVLQNEKSKELNRERNTTPQPNNEIKFDSPLTPITTNSAGQDIKIIITDTSESLNASVNSVDSKLKIPPTPTPTYTNVKSKIEQANNAIRLEDTKPTLTESLPRITITKIPLKTTKSGVSNYKNKTLHSKHSANEERKKIKPKFISKYKRAEMFKKATEKILGRLESAKTKVGQKGKTNISAADLPTSIVNDLKTPACKNLSAIQDNQATENSEMFKKTTENISGRLKSTKSKVGQKADLPKSTINDLKTPAFENPSALQHNQAPDNYLPDFKSKNLKLGRVERYTIPNKYIHKTKSKTVSANSKLLPKLDTDILNVKKVPKVFENDIKMEKEGATAVGNISPHTLDPFKAKNSLPADKLYQSLNTAKNKNSTKTEEGNTPPPFVNILKGMNSPPTYQINQSLNMAKKKSSTKNDQVGNIPPPPVNTLETKNSPPFNQINLNMAKNKNFTKTEKVNFPGPSLGALEAKNSLGNIPPPTMDTLIPKNSPPPNKVYQFLNMAKSKNSKTSEREAKNSPLSNKMYELLNMAKNNIFPKSGQGNIPFVNNINAKNSAQPGHINQSLNTAKNENSTKSEQATKKADNRIWTTLPEPQENIENPMNSPQNNLEDSSLKRKSNLDLPLSDIKADEISSSATNINSKSAETMKQPLIDVGKGNHRSYKPNNTIRDNLSKSSTTEENATNPATSVYLDKDRSSTSPSHYPKNMFGEIISPEQLRKSQEKLRAFQTNLDVTTARPSPKKISNKHSTTENTKTPDKVSRPGPSKKPVSDGGSGNDGDDNSGGSEAIHDTKGHFANFWSTATITTMYLVLSFMIYLMKELPSLNPWQQFFTYLTKEQTEAILRIHKATYEKKMTNSDLHGNMENDMLPQNIVTGSNDQNNSNDIGDPKVVTFDKNSKFEDV